MKINIRLTKPHALIALTLTLPGLLISCATRQPLVLGIIGPKSATERMTEGQGYLVVYSETEPVRLDKGLPYYIHTSYLVQKPDGIQVRWIPNHVGDMDEAPQLVPLAAGAYHIVAESADYGRVRVPVVIAPFQTTTVHLQGKGSWKPQAPPKQDSELVRLPDGEPIGWHEVSGN